MRSVRAAYAVLTFLATAFAFALAFAAAPARAETFYVDGHGGVPLAVTVVGPESGPEILYLHGIGMGAESFSEQLQSELAQKFRMVAFDLRGHGMSGKPWEAQAYTSRQVWAEDVQRVIDAAGLKRPIIVAWSYGALVAADHLLLNGSGGTAGLVLVSSVGGLVPAPVRNDHADETVAAQLQRYGALRQIPGLEAQREATEILAPMLFEATPEGPSDNWIAGTKALGLLVPPYAQPHLRAHPYDNAKLASRLAQMPLQLFHGAKDLAVSDGEVAAFKMALPHAEILTFEGAGHSLFAEQPAAFNAALTAFVWENWSIPNDQ